MARTIKTQPAAKKRPSGAPYSVSLKRPKTTERIKRTTEAKTRNPANAFLIDKVWLRRLTAGAFEHAGVHSAEALHQKRVTHQFRFGFG